MKRSKTLPSFLTIFYLDSSPFDLRPPEKKLNVATRITQTCPEAIF